jgi:hypothetical protein
MARTFRGQPFVTGHNWADARARGGTVLDAWVDEVEGELLMLFELLVTEEWAIRGFENGTIDRFSIGADFLGEILSNVEAFTGIGFYARPPSSSGTPEAIGVGVGGNGPPLIIAVRDEATRQARVRQPADSTAVFNTKAVVAISPDGTVEIRLVGGAAVKLATLADVQALAAFVQKMPLPVSGGTAGLPAPISVPTPTGTTVLRAQ